jgi:hypothetical protein
MASGSLITQHRQLARSQMPKGTGQHKQRGAFTTPQGEHGKCTTITGIRLVRWLKDNGRRDEALELLVKIRVGLVSAI